MLHLFDNMESFSGKVDALLVYPGSFHFCSEKEEQKEHDVH
jgi:hypothetical protein